MSSNPCIAEIQRAAGRKLTDDELDDLLSELQKRVRQRRALDNGEAMDASVKAAADDYAKEMAEAAIIEKRNAAINLRRRLEAADKINTVFASNPALGVESLLVGVNNAATGSRLSVASEQRQLAAHYSAGFMTEVEKAGLWKEFVSGDLDRDIAKALWAINRAEPQPRTVPREAHQIAEIIQKWQEVSRQDANAAGAWIKKIEGYITRQSHDTFKIRDAGFDAWKAEILPKLDLARTLDGATDANAFLKAVYQGLASGIHLKSVGDPSGFKGPRNIAKKASEERVLHFKGPDEWFDYNARFGTGTLREAVLHNLEMSAQNTGLMRILGTNPEANLQRITDAVLKGIADPGKQADFASTMAGKIKNQLRTVDGTTRIPVNHVLARRSSAIRAVENMAKLGAALFSQFSDLPVYASEMRYQGGGGYLSNILDGVQGMLRGRGSEERKELAGMLGVFSDSMSGNVVSRFSPGEDGVPGLLTKSQQLFFKFNGMQWWTDSLRRAAYETMAHRLALNAGKSWKQLDPDLARTLGLFAIDEGSWNVIRRATLKDVDGRSFVVPESVAQVADEHFAALLTSQGVKVTPKRIADLKRELSSKVRSYYVDRAEYAVLTPDARTRATLLQGTQAGTVNGEFWRFLMQFKSFTGAFTQKVLGREVYGRGAVPNAGLIQALRNGNGEIIGLAQLMLWTTVFGYLSGVSKDLVKGREPRNPTDPKAWLAAMVQGGGAGIYGDFLFGEVRNRFGGGLLSTLAGPTLGTVEDIADLWGRLRNGDDTAAAAVKLAISNTPGANLFYTRVVMDYLFLHQISEWLNPGSLKRMERRIQKENGQDFLVRPSENHVRW